MVSSNPSLLFPPIRSYNTRSLPVPTPVPTLPIPAPCDAQVCIAPALHQGG